jgi:hypothetical protein
MFLALCAGALTLAGAGTAALASTTNQAKPKAQWADLTVPGDNFYPESIASTPDGTLFVSSITTGEIDKFPANSTTAQTFVLAGVNIGTAGVFADPSRGVLWSCAIDLSFATPTALKAFSLSTGALVASYTFTDGGVCADIVTARGTVYVTDTANPTVSGSPGRIFKLTTPAGSAAGGTLSLWSADPALTHGAGLQINGITFDGVNTLYTTNYNSGELLKVGIDADGSASAATVVLPAGTYVNPDGIRMLDHNHLLVTENPGRLDEVNVATATNTVLNSTLDQPTSVVINYRGLWVSEGQDLRLQQGQAPNLPFKVRYLPFP